MSGSKEFHKRQKVIFRRWNYPSNYNYRDDGFYSVGNAVGRYVGNPGVVRGRVNCRDHMLSSPAYYFGRVDDIFLQALLPKMETRCGAYY